MALIDGDSNNVEALADAAVSEEEDDSDRELQIAFEEGLLKTDRLNYVVDGKRPIINKKEELQLKTEELKKNLMWIETLDLTVKNEYVRERTINDDFEREILFYKQAEGAVKMAIPRLRKLGVKIFRPPDYYAEMVKSDNHMQKVRQRMAELEEDKKKQEAIRRIREEKKFAAKVQKEVMDRKQSEKKILLEAVKEHRKGMKSQLDFMLKNAKRLQETEEEEDFVSTGKKSEENRRGRKTKKFSRISRDKKFSFGGQKKRSKKNDKNSFEEFATPGNLAFRMKRHRVGGSSRKGHLKRKSK
ncbi:unnamed protein product [Thelazia callipaeda]|uniref:rRNA-processing protein EBP2 homolog n=1 Tax=Thelazia callipaeda TaxID=103827 RepID=A0A0N5CWS2_THECL|nr:unnamed protein product [Thelazia callipaeda]